MSLKMKNLPIAYFSLINSEYMGHLIIFTTNFLVEIDESMDVQTLIIFL
jgi:hypothetical protein